MDEIKVVEVKTQLVLGMHKRGPYCEISNMIPNLFKYACSKNINMIDGHPIFICHEMTVEEAEMASQKGIADVEVAIPIYGDAEESEKIKRYELPGEKMAKIVHKGPYEEYTSTYEKLFNWLKENKKQLAGPIREVYINDPREVRPEDILTEIYAPIE